MKLLVGLGAKIYLLLAGLLLIFGFAISLFVKFEFSQQLRQELQKRGATIARNLAQTSVTPILARDRLNLRLIARKFVQSEDDIVYIFFLGSHETEVLGHSFAGDFPGELLGANPLPADSRLSIRQFYTDRGEVYDFAVPVAGGGLGAVRLGISVEPLQGAVADLTGTILRVSLWLSVLLLLLGIPLSALVARPLRRLTQATRKVAEGELEVQVAEGPADEMGQLARAFNRMTQELHSSHCQLVKRNSELAAEVEKRQAAERTLSEQLNFLKTLLEHLPTPVFFKDRSNLYRGCNQAYAMMFGRSCEEVVGQSVAQIYPAAEARVHEMQDCQLWQQFEPLSYELQIQTPARRRDVIFHKACFFDADGQPKGLVGVVIDVTDEREINRLRSEFVSTTAHEFQTPLTAILGFCELLQGEIPPGSAADYIEIIHERAEFLSRLVDQFLDVSRIDNGRSIPILPRACDPQKLIAHILVSLKPAERQRVRVNFPEPCPQVEVDTDRLTQVIQNLLGNAFKYSQTETPVVISAQTRGDWLEISVQDQGQGLEPEDVVQIFDKFFRARHDDSGISGTGLGLYISKAIVEAHGGCMTAISHKGQGTCLIFTLPLNAEASTG